KRVAGPRRVVFVEEFCKEHIVPRPLNDDGMHLSDFGYWWTAPALRTALGVPMAGYRKVELVGTEQKELLEDILPKPPAPRGTKPPEDTQADSIVIARGLKPGRYTLTIDGRAVHTED